MIDGYAGDVFQTGAVVHYHKWNISIAGVAPVRVVLLGSSAWVPGIEVRNTNPAAELSLVGNVVSNCTSCTAGNGWIPDDMHEDTLALIAKGFDALREAGGWDLRINFPGLL